MKMKKSKLLAIICAAVIIVAATISVFVITQNGYTTVIAGSDFQSGDIDTGVEIMDGIFESINEDGIKSADGFFFMGDYDRDSLSHKEKTQAGVNAVKEKAEDFSPDDTYLIKGNHDSNDSIKGMSKSGANDPKSGKYGVFVINENDYMWHNNNLPVIAQTAQNLTDYLNEKLQQNFEKPIFVLSHLPLHYSMRTANDGDGRYAEYIFNVLNRAGKKGLNIVFMFGHDHSNGWDDYLGGSSIFLNRGDSILIAQSSNTLFEECKLNFYYLNAGYVGYYSNHNGADDTLTMTAVQFNSEKIIFNRYDSDGGHKLKASGKTNAYKNESGYEPNTDTYASSVESKLTKITDTKPLPEAY